MDSLDQVTKVILFIVRARKILTYSLGDVAEGIFVEEEKEEISNFKPGELYIA